MTCILSWNVNGLRSILKKGFLEVVDRERPDVICLQEIKARASDVGELAELLSGFDLHFSSAEKPGYSGVATFISKKGPALIKTARTRFGTQSDLFSREGRILITDLGDILLYNLYFPSGTSGETRQSVKYEFLGLVLEHFSELPATDQRRLVLCGDFNICHREIDIHHPAEATRRQLTGFLPEERAWMDRLTSFGMVDSFRHLHPTTTSLYTWWTFRAGARGKNLGWRIDYQFVATPLAADIGRAEILSKVTGSDHCPTLLELN